jgi:hypothetical protein
MEKTKKKYSLFQVQLESSNTIYSLEVGTNDYNADDVARGFLLSTEDTDIDTIEEARRLHTGGYCEIGTTTTYGVNTIDILRS